MNKTSDIRAEKTAVQKQTYMPGFFREKLNLNEFAYDCAVLFFPFIISRFYDPIVASSPFGIPSISFILLLAIYFLPVFIGKLYRVEFKTSHRYIRNAVLFILFAATLFAFSHLLYLTVPRGIEIPSAGGFILITAIVLLIMGPIAGLAFNNKAVNVGGLTPQLTVLLFTLGILPLFFMLVAGGELFGDTNGFLAMLIILGLMIADAAAIALCIFFFIWLKGFLTRIGAYPYVGFAATFLSPFFASFILVFFNIQSDRIFLGSIGIHSPGTAALVVFLYLITGVIPLRIMLMLAPPIRPLNIVIGVISAASMFILIILR